jgi:hypothetical protein
MTKWFTDSDGDLYRHSKEDGGVQVEKEDGTFGKAIPLIGPPEEMGLTPVDPVTNAILCEFDRLRSNPDDPALFRRTRSAVVEIAQRLNVHETAQAAGELTTAPQTASHQAEPVQAPCGHVSHAQR